MIVNFITYCIIDIIQFVVISYQTKKTFIAGRTLPGNKSLVL